MERSQIFEDTAFTRQEAGWCNSMLEGLDRIPPSPLSVFAMQGHIPCIAATAELRPLGGLYSFLQRLCDLAENG